MTAARERIAAAAARWQEADTAALDAAVQLRLDTELIERLHRLEAVMRGAGHRNANRSFLARAALRTFLDEAEIELGITDPPASPPPGTGRLADVIGADVAATYFEATDRARRSARADAVAAFGSGVPRRRQAGPT